jgi:hypothetical protein
MEECFFGGKVVVEHASRNMERFGDLTHSQCSIPILGEEIDTLIQEMFTKANMIDQFRHGVSLLYLYRTLGINKDT